MWDIARGYKQNMAKKTNLKIYFLGACTEDNKNIFYNIFVYYIKSRVPINHTYQDDVVHPNKSLTETNIGTILVSYHICMLC